MQRYSASSSQSRSSSHVNEINPQEIKKSRATTPTFPRPSNTTPFLFCFFFFMASILSIHRMRPDFFFDGRELQKKEKGSHNTINQLTPFLVTDWARLSLLFVCVCVWGRILNIFFNQRNGEIIFSNKEKNIHHPPLPPPSPLWLCLVSYEIALALLRCYWLNSFRTQVSRQHSCDCPEK